MSIAPEHPSLLPVVVAVFVETPREDAFARFTAADPAWSRTAPAPGAEGTASWAGFDRLDIGASVQQRQSARELAPRGAILAYEPPRSLTFSWRVGPTGEAHHRIDVSFTLISRTRTYVELIHSGWDLFDEPIASLRDSYTASWQTLLNLYAAAA